MKKIIDITILLISLTFVFWVINANHELIYYTFEYATWDKGTLIGFALIPIMLIIIYFAEIRGRKNEEDTTG